MDAIKTLKNIHVKTEIYETTNYDLFRLVNGNRIVNSLNYTKLIKSIEQKQLLIPICVNEKMEIVDVQHRFIACKEFGKSIYFYVANVITLRM